MTRLFTIFVLTFALLPAVTLLNPGNAAAVNVFTPCNGTAASGSSVCTDAKNQGSGSNANPVIHVIKIAINLLTLVIGIASVIIIIVSGLRMVVSAGDSQAVSTARQALLYALIGLAIALLAQGFVAFVLNKLQ